MKVTILVLMVSLMLFLNMSQADVSIDLRLLQQNVNIGDEFSVQVNIHQVSDLKGVNFLISFDNLKLEYRSISKGNLISDFTEDIIPDPKTGATTGKIEYLAVLQAPGPGIESASGTILTLNFKAKVPGDAWVKFSDVLLGDSTANAIPYKIDIPSITVRIGQVFALKRVFNYPNPAPDASGKTVIRCESLAILEGLEARIYDISGELVKTIDYQDFNSSQAPVYEYEWDCKNEKGQNVANGTYILWLKAKMGSDEKYETWKIAILR